MICPFCGGISIKNGSNRAKCKVCERSFNKSEGESWKVIKNDVVHGEEHFSRDIEIEQLI